MVAVSAPALAALAARNLGIQLLQPLKFRDPLSQGQAVNGGHVDGPVQPIFSLAKLEIEIAAALSEAGGV